MDAFELIRRSAGDLHDDVVREGIDPFDVSSLVAKAASLRRLEIILVPADDPSLMGARALHDEQAGAILVGSEGTPIDHAMLVAHEIGHEVHHKGSQECGADDVDLSRSTEAAPVGLQRVEDYGVRERRELQANVFARELVLPRGFARLLHVDQGMTARQIAERMKLTLALVRQQICDAVLLPVMEADPPATPTPAVNDPAQDQAAEHRGSPYQLQAGPGTGKTRTLVKRIKSLVDEKVDPNSILALTFSNRAAGELAERVAAVLPDEAPRIWIGTFHSFGLDLLRRHGETAGLPSDPSLFDRSDAIAVLEEITPTLGLHHYRNLWDPTLRLRDVLSAISRAKDELVDEVRYRELADAMKDGIVDAETKIAAEKCAEIALIYEHYEAAKRQRGAVDFGDLIMLPVRILENETIAAAVQLRHRHVLVDEYQDVNRASVRLVQSVAGDGKRLWVVGDARQSIYRFRGASSGNMAAFSSDFPGAMTNALGRSYRSTEGVIKTFSSFAGTMSASDGMLPLNLETDHGPGHRTEIRAFDTPDNELEGIAGSIAELRSNGVNLRDQAILCRTNARLNDVANALEARGIPVLHLGSLFERDEIRDLLALLSLAVDRRGAGLVRVGAMSRYRIGLQDIYRAVQILRETDVPPLTGLAKLRTDVRLSIEAREKFRVLVADLDGFHPGMMAWDLIMTYLLDRTDMVREMAARTSISDWMQSAAVWQFLNFLRDESPVGGGLPIWRTLERIRALVLLAEERDLRQVPASALRMDAVRLMTIHGSKGLEFEAVHIPGMTEVGLPSSYQGMKCPPAVGMIADSGSMSVDAAARQSHLAEEECLFFVAMSRARSHLRLYRSATQRNGTNRTESRFLSRISGAIQISSPVRIPLPPDAPRPMPVSVAVATDFAVTDGSLSTYKKCPRRFFYTHMLGLGGAKKPTLFTQTHGCLYKLIDWIHACQIAGAPTLAEAEAQFEIIWKEHGPADHPACSDYRQLASRIVAALVGSSRDRKFLEAEAIAIDLPGGRLIVEPDAISQMPDGTIVLRRLRTGYKRTNEYGSTEYIEYGLYAHAGRTKFGKSAQVEAVHLTDDLTELVTISDKVISNRVNEASDILASIRAGTFAPDPEPIICARCPHFFVCAATPEGALILDSKEKSI